MCVCVCVTTPPQGADLANVLQEKKASKAGFLQLQGESIEAIEQTNLKVPYIPARIATFSYQIADVAGQIRKKSSINEYLSWKQRFSR